MRRARQRSFTQQSQVSQKTEEKIPIAKQRRLIMSKDNKYLRVCLLLLMMSAALSMALTTKSPSNNDGLQATRRQVLNSGLQIATGWVVLPAAPAIAARGAAELDFEYYMRDLVGGNKKEGNVLPSQPPVSSPPRRLQGQLIPLLLDADCTPSCLTVQALIQQIKTKNNNNKDESAIAEDIQSRVKILKEKASRSFSTRSPWREESVTDQYYFDFTSYVLWRVAAELLPDYLERDKFVRRLGKLIYENLQKGKLISSESPSSDRGGDKRKGLLTSTVATIRETLDVFTASQYCRGYRIRGELDDENEVFDELDDESILTGGSVDFIASIYEPATLQASLQITGEQSRFGPDFVGTTLAAIFADAANVRSSWETFFVDPEYRPNPKDYFPNEQLFQFTLVRNN